MDSHAMALYKAVGSVQSISLPILPVFPHMTCALPVLPCDAALCMGVARQPTSTPRVSRGMCFGWKLEVGRRVKRRP